VNGIDRLLAGMEPLADAGTERLPIEPSNSKKLKALGYVD